MALSRLGKPGQSNSSAIALIECSVRVSPTLARLIRKSAEKEMSGASAKDALLTAAGVQPGEVATLQRELQQASEESKQSIYTETQKPSDVRCRSRCPELDPGAGTRRTCWPHRTALSA